MNYFLNGYYSKGDEKWIQIVLKAAILHRKRIAAEYDF